jgi:fatty-acyl-CoA synthase
MPIDLQDALCAHPDVRYAVALPSAGGRFGAVVVRAPGSPTTETELQAYVADRHGAHLVPDPVRLVDRVPVTEQGKPDRAQLSRLLVP